MIVAVASGKGGTGKTTVASSLARTWDGPVMAVDLDVEAPNLHLFLKPKIDSEESVGLEVPVADPSKCNGCGACGDFCQFNAITVFGNFPAVFSEMCHGCGGCLAVCPTGALAPGSRILGEVLWGETEDHIRLLMGRLRVGEAMSPPLIRAVRRRMATPARTHRLDSIVDAPPGTSCPAMNAVMDADLIVLVTEPTPFGRHDLALARDAFRQLGKPLAVVVNRAGLGDGAVYDDCRAADLPVLTEIPHDRRVAEAYARGELAIDLSPTDRERYRTLVTTILRMVDTPEEVCGA